MWKNFKNSKEPGLFNEEEDLHIGETLKEENYYKFHENVAHYDPRGQPYSYFYITITGQIEYGDFPELDGLQLHFNFVAGEDWNLANGINSGIG